MSRAAWAVSRAVVAAVVLAGGCSLAACSNQPDGVAGADPPSEFACYMDGELTERHVGVLGVRRMELMDALAWAIYYQDGPTVTYLQQPGEACGIEPTTSATTEEQRHDDATHSAI